MSSRETGRLSCSARRPARSTYISRSVSAGTGVTDTGTERSVAVTTPRRWMAHFPHSKHNRSSNAPERSVRYDIGPSLVELLGVAEGRSQHKLALSKVRPEAPQLLRIRRHRLVDEHRQARFQERQGHLGVALGVVPRQNHRVDGIFQVAPVFYGTRNVAGRLQAASLLRICAYTCETHTLSNSILKG